jgi:patatin-like phospholipase/acyl hydrolase
LDGGGIRGVYAARLVERLEGALPGLLGSVDLFAGTSTGGVIALALSAGATPAEIVAIYRDRGREIFDDSWFDNLKDVGKWAGADYDNRKLKEILKEFFETRRGKRRLDDLSPRRVLVPAFDLDYCNRQDPASVRRWKPKFFHNYPGPGSDGAEGIVDVAMRTSAAPTYFPTYDGFIDGGVAANNPSMAALAQALDKDGGNKELGDLLLLSIGTGFNPTYIAGRSLDWGYAQWAKPLVSLMIDGAMGVVDYECSHILKDKYHRLDRPLPKSIPLDDYVKADLLIQLADKVDLAPTITWLKNVSWAQDTTSPG